MSKRGYKQTKDHKRKISEAQKGEKGYWYGKSRPEKTKMRMKESRKQYFIKYPEVRKEIGERSKGNTNTLGKHWKVKDTSKVSRYWLGKKRSPETIEKFKKSHLGHKNSEKSKEMARKRWLGDKNPNWANGISFEPYGLEFNEDLKEVIRNRDRRKCRMCEKTELENKKKLDVHHIDYNKRNNNPNNLISLCMHCHRKTNHHRKYWSEYFNDFEIT